MRFAFLFGVLANILYGSSYSVQKLALETWPPVLLSIARLTITMLFFAPFVSFKVMKGATRNDWIRIIVAALFGMALPYLVGSYGLQATDSVNGAVLGGLEPIATLLLSIAVLKERVGGLRIVGLWVGFLGAAWVVTGGDVDQMLGAGSLRGNMLMAAQAVFWAIYTIAAKPTLERITPMMYSFVTSVVALIAMLPLGFVEYRAIEPNVPALFEATPLISMVYLAVLVSFVAMILWNHAVKALPSSQVAVFLFLQPLVGTLAGWLLGEALLAATVMGGVLIALGVWLSDHEPDKRHSTVNSARAVAPVLRSRQ
ncbi:MAG: DMT family transporter [Deltaproteobacteria bacterium]|nr:DMT family transporter [Deltaproteobacteria bacterium]